jgi:predicted DNA-binding transcriptional regulator AlpA
MAYDHLPADGDALLTAHEVSIFTGISEKTLGEWRYHGIQLRYHKLGNSVRYRKEDIEAWLETNRKDVDPDGLLTSRQRAAVLKHTQAVREFLDAHPELTAMMFIEGGGLAGRWG